MNSPEDSQSWTPPPAADPQTTLSAACYLYYDAIKPWVLDDPATVMAEAMTRADFEAYQNENADLRTAQFMEAMRNVVLNQNASGEFFGLRISPAVLTDDWVLRATSFVQQLRISEENESNKKKEMIQLELGIAEKRKGFFTDGMLVIKKSGKAENLGLPLVSFPMNRDSKPLQLKLDELLKQVHAILVESFPEIKVLPPEQAEILLCDKSNESQASRNGGEIGVALKRMEELKARGASKEEIKAEMKKIRAMRKAEGIGTIEINNEAPLVKAITCMQGDVTARKRKACTKASADIAMPLLSKTRSL